MLRSEHLPPPIDGGLILRDFSTWNIEPGFERVLVTGATGLIGRWLLSALASLNQHAGKYSDVVVISRNPSEANRRLHGLPRLNLSYSPTEAIKREIAEKCPTHIWHLAASTGSVRQESIIEPINADLALALEIANALEKHPRETHLLYSSSGAVYGRESAPLRALEPQVPMTTSASSASLMYGLGKLTSEGIFYALNQSGCASVSIARLFTFVGPLMPLDAHFAIGNFMSAALRGDAIRMNSRGNAVRSWMHLQDLARYLLLLSASRRSSIVDIGEEASMTIAEAAQLVAEIANVGVEFGTEENPSGSSMRYLPDLRALWSLGPRLLTKSHLESFEDTYRWLKSSNNFA